MLFFCFFGWKNLLRMLATVDECTIQTPFFGSSFNEVFIVEYFEKKKRKKKTCLSLFCFALRHTTKNCVQIMCNEAKARSTI